MRGRSALARILLLFVGVLLVQLGHGDALGGPNGGVADPDPPPVLAYPLQDPIVVSERAGNLAGSSSVGPTGEYSYRLPIQVPPGRAGMQPSLELRYSSGLGNGHLAVGWSLTGLSEIRRCSKTWATEGFADGVDFDDSDAFCLDGQKLRQINGDKKKNGHEGAEYRTERDTFARIVAHGDTALGPDEFRVEARNGLTFKYDVRVEPHRFRGGFPHEEPEDKGVVRAVWLLGEVWDRSGNAMTYEYEVFEDPETRGVEHRIQRIRYTGKHVEGADPQGALRKIEFEYGKREGGDNPFRYQSGVRWETRSALKRITLWAPDPVAPAKVGEYRLSYAASVDTGRLLLQSVSRCDAKEVCLRAKHFRWWERSIAGEPPEFQDVPITPTDTTSGTLPDSVMVADVNGDGLDDVLYRAGSGLAGGSVPVYLHLAQRDADGTLSFGQEILVNAQGHEFSDTELRRSRPADIDGDGAAEVVAAIDPDIDPANPLFTTRGYQIFRWNDAEQAFLPVGDFLDADPRRDAIQLTDFDGDGRIDLFREEADLSDGSGAADLGTWQLQRNEPISGDNFHFADPLNSKFLAAQGPLARAFDVDGDGRGDLLPIDSETIQDGSDDTGVIPGATIQLGLNDDGEMATDGVWRLRSFARMQLVDLNGDGLRDALYPLGPDTQVRWNLGLGFGPLTPLPSTIVPVDSASMAPDLGLRTGDFDGDGLEDLVSFENGGDDPTAPQTRLFRFRGDHIEGAELGVEGTLPAQHADNGATVQDGWPYCTTGDFDGDGQTDLLHTHVESLIGDDGAPHAVFRMWASIRRRGPSDRLFEISDEDSPTPTESVFYDRVRSESPSPCVWPQLCVKRGIEVVTLTATAAGGESVESRYRQYSYEDARSDLQGRGFLGFGKTTVFDEQRLTFTKTTFDHTTRVLLPTGGSLYPYAGLPAVVTHFAPIFETPGLDDSPWPHGGEYPGRITTVETHYNQNTPNDPDALWSDPAAGTFLVHSLGSTIVESEAQVLVEPSQSRVTLVAPGDPQDIREIDTAVVYDAFENPVFVSRMTTGGTYSWTATTYENRVADWLLGLPTHTETTTEDLDNPAAEARTTDYHFDDLGRLEWVTIEPGHDELRRKTTFLRDASGLPLQIAVGTTDGTRKTFLAYDDLEGIFLRAAWNQVGHAERAVYHPAFGVPVITEDPNGVQVRTTYDGFGRPRSITPDDGGAASVSYLSKDCKTSAAERGMCMSVVHADGGKEVTYSDEFSRVWETADTGFDGALVFHRQRYNVFGQPVEITRPFTDLEGGLTKARFDSLDRPLEIEAPDTSVTSFSYEGLFASTAVDPNGHKTSVLRDRDGRVTTTWDAAGAPTHFGYGPFDQITSVEDPQGNTTSLGYDKLGRRTLLVDPDQGTTTFEHDAFGALRFVRHHLTDANSPADLVTEYRQDVLGRVYRRLDTYAADPPVTDITDYWYDNAPHALGKLIATKSPDGVETAHHYDAQGRLSATDWTIDGQTFSVGSDYDLATGKLRKLTYPAQGALFRVGLAYNPAGWLESVSRLTSPVTASLWRVESRNVDGLLTSAVWHHPGVKENRTYSALTGRLHHITTKGDTALTDLTYAYDPAGNVTYRHDDVAGRTEDFAYDERDRLVQWKLTVSGGPGAQSSRTTDYGYDDLGNLTQVLEDGALLEKHAIDPAHPHRLTTLTRGGVDRAYFHDARGREQEDSDGRIYTYTPFDLPRHVSRPDLTIAGATATTDFAFDAFGARVKKTTAEGGVVSTTITLGGLYERRERVDPNGVTVQHVHYIPGDGGAVAQIAIDDATHEETTTYLARDGLGSVTVAFDEKGKETERPFHEPFGGRIQSDGSPLDVWSSKAGVSLGFAGQYTDDDLGLIDMNGRVYDPTQKRFLTPDPFVADPLDSQSYNRYSYVLNNPLRYTDPNGFGPESWPPVPGIVPIGYVAAMAAQDAAAKTPKGPPPPPPQDKQPPGGSSDGTGHAPPKPPGAGPPPPPDNPGDDTGGPNDGGLDEGTAKDLDGGDDRKEEESPWRDNFWIQGAGKLVSGLGHVIGIGRNDNGREPDERKTVGVIVGVGVGSTAVGLGVIVALPAVAIGTVLVKTGVVGVGAAAAGAGAGAGVGVGNGNGTGPLHHIATNKNYIAGGRWSAEFEPMFQKAGLSLNDPRNTVNVPGHYGPHPQEYHQKIYDRLSAAVDGRSGPAYREALLQELDRLGAELQTEGTALNRLVTGR